MPVSKSAYTVKSIIKMSNPKSTLIRIEPTDLHITLREIYMSISNLCWISKLPHISTAATKFQEKFLEELGKLRQTGIGENEIKRIVSQLTELVNGGKE